MHGMGVRMVRIGYGAQEGSILGNMYMRYMRVNAIVADCPQG